MEVMEVMVEVPCMDTGNILDSRPVIEVTKARSLVIALWPNLGWRFT